MGNINAVMCRLKPSPVLKPTNGTWIGAHIAMPVGKVIIPSNMFSLLNRVASDKAAKPSQRQTSKKNKKRASNTEPIYFQNDTPPAR